VFDQIARRVRQQSHQSSGISIPVKMPQIHPGGGEVARGFTGSHPYIQQSIVLRSFYLPSNIRILVPSPTDFLRTTQLYQTAP
jgi:hypothetical protein